MPAYGDRHQYWTRMPPILQDDVGRLPKGQSWSRERDAGRALIALCWPKLHPDRIFIRNVSRRTAASAGGGMKAEAKRAGLEGMPVIVENMREFGRIEQRLKVAEGKKTGSYIQASRLRLFRSCYLHKLQAKGWQVVAGPFLLEEPMHNCGLELTRSEWDEIWETHRSPHRSVRHLSSQTSSRFIDTEETPQAAEIRLHYRGLRVTEDWTPARVNKIAEEWGMTLRELQHYVCCETLVLERFMAGEVPTLPGPICLWFFFMERLAAERAGKRFDLPTFPVVSPQAA